jgi:DNA-binding transcriptional ArsR family regulator
MKRPEPTPAVLFAALGDTTRLRLVLRLSHGEPLSIKQLATGTRMTRQSVTKHLHVLAGAGVAAASTHGRERRWSLDPHHLDSARQFLDRLAQQWDGALGRLKALAEEDADS